MRTWKIIYIVYILYLFPVQYTFTTYTVLSFYVNNQRFYTDGHPSRIDFKLQVFFS